MKLDKRHLIVSVALLLGSIIYNVWVFTRPASGTSAVVATQPAALDAFATPPASGMAAAAPLDPARVKPLPDVALGRLPQWPRDPFASRRPEVPPIVEASTAPRPEPVAEPDLVVASILYSADRRLAMIDGRVARIGDVISGVTIIDILPKAVVIESPARGRRTLTLRPPAGTGVIAQ